jgi:hypothetical protein
MLMTVLPGMGIHTYDPNTLEAEEDHKFEATLDYTARPISKKSPSLSRCFDRWIRWVGRRTWCLIIFTTVESP